MTPWVYGAWTGDLPQGSRLLKRRRPSLQTLQLLSLFHLQFLAQWQDQRSVWQHERDRGGRERRKEKRDGKAGGERRVLNDSVDPIEHGWTNHH